MRAVAIQSPLPLSHSLSDDGSPQSPATAGLLRDDKRGFIAFTTQAPLAPCSRDDKQRETLPYSRTAPPSDHSLETRRPRRVA